MNTSTLVQKLWNYCSVLRDDGMSLLDTVRLTPATGNKSLAHLERIGIVGEVTNRQRGRVFSYRRHVAELAAELKAPA